MTAIIFVGAGSFIQWWKVTRLQREHGGGQSSHLVGHWDEDAIAISAQCAKCHKKEYDEWVNSDHAWAYRSVSKEDGVAFHGQRLTSHGESLRFSSDLQGNFIVTDEKTKQSWPVVGVVGRTPLIQFLLPSSSGKQALSAAWDVNKKEWFDIFNSDQREPRDWGHWQGRGMTWNTQCAWCHMSGYQKKFNQEKNKYESTWKEPGVTCIQCHSDMLSSPHTSTGCLVNPGVKLTRRQVGDNCASCHARRQELSHDFTAGKNFDDYFFLALPVQPGLFWPNGMQRDEDYCETGLRLSRMGQAGVTCIDCHSPHSGQPILSPDNNALCLRCHSTGEKVGTTMAPVIDMSTHSPCVGGTPRCIDCHMPSAPYMGRDPRRDHSFAMPDIKLAAELSIPVSCSKCHPNMEQDFGVFSNHIEKAEQNTNLMNDRARTRAIQHAYEHAPDAGKELAAVYAVETNPAWRATLLELMNMNLPVSGWASPAVDALKSDSPLLRAVATRLLAQLPQVDLSAMLQDPSAIVRFEGLWALRDKLPTDSKEYAELLRVLNHWADQPAGMLRMAQLCEDQQDMETAQMWFEKALALDQRSSSLLREYALFWSRQGKSDLVIENLKKSLAVNAQDDVSAFLLGLAFAENKKFTEALDALSSALSINPQFTKARYNRAILFHQLKLTEKAIDDLKICMTQENSNATYPYHIAQFYYEINKLDEAKSYAQQALKLDPNNNDIRYLIQLIK